MGKGICPPTCPNYEAAVKAAEEVKDISPEMQRTMVFFADAWDTDTNLLDIARLMAGCIKENPKA